MGAGGAARRRRARALLHTRGGRPRPTSRRHGRGAASEAACRGATRPTARKPARYAPALARAPCAAPTYPGGQPTVCGWCRADPSIRLTRGGGTASGCTKEVPPASTIASAPSGVSAARGGGSRRVARRPTSAGPGAGAAALVGGRAAATPSGTTTRPRVLGLRLGRGGGRCAPTSTATLAGAVAPVGVTTRNTCDRVATGRGRPDSGLCATTRALSAGPPQGVKGPCPTGTAPANDTDRGPEETLRLLEEVWLKKRGDKPQLRAAPLLEEPRPARRLLGWLSARLSKRRDPLPPQLFALLEELTLGGARMEFRELRVLGAPL